MESKNSTFVSCCCQTLGYCTCAKKIPLTTEANFASALRPSTHCTVIHGLIWKFS